MRPLLRTVGIALASSASFAADLHCSSLASMQWLLGEWHAESGATTWHESWGALDAKTWQGRGIESSKSDPARQSVEDLRLVEMGGRVFYVAKVAHNELPVAFRLVECGEGRLVFSNPAHDFPKRLEYLRQPEDRLRVHVSDGAEQGFTLDFTRVQ